MSFSLRSPCVKIICGTAYPHDGGDTRRKELNKLMPMPSRMWTWGHEVLEIAETSDWPLTLSRTLPNVFALLSTHPSKGFHGIEGRDLKSTRIVQLIAERSLLVLDHSCQISSRGIHRMWLMKIEDIPLMGTKPPVKALALGYLAYVTQDTVMLCTQYSRQYCILLWRLYLLDIWRPSSVEQIQRCKIAHLFAKVDTTFAEVRKGKGP